MRRLRPSRVLVLAGIVCAVGSSGGAVAGVASSFAARIVFVNVGQGDGVVMKVGGKVIVSDAGEFNAADVNDALSGVTSSHRIDVAILSHPHQDHVKNFVDLIDVYGWKIKLAVLSRSAYWQGTATNRALMDHLAATDKRYVTAGDDFDWGGADWRILNPPAGRFTGGAADAANSSVAFLLTVEGVRALFTGDIEPDVAADVAHGLVAGGLDEPVDVFLATHHGSKYGSVIDLLNVIRPRWVVLSTGPNSFGHPALSTIQRLEDTGATIWCTAVNGSVTARISRSGTLTWRASAQVAPWWSGETQKETGTCVDR